MTTVPLNQIFDVINGNSLELNRLDRCSLEDQNSINFVSRTRENNGVSAIVCEIDDVEPFEEGLISVAGSGNSVLEAFIQPYRFYTGYHVFILKPKKKLTASQKLFYCYCIKKNKFKYSYGRQANRTLKNLLVPSIDDIPEEFLKPPELKISKAPVLKQSLELDTSSWKVFKYGGKEGVFIIKNGYYKKKPECTEKGDVPFIVATDFNNGVTGFYSLFDIENSNKDERSADHPIDQKIFKGNCVTVSNNGSVGYAFYQEKDFTCSHDVNVLYLKGRKWNKYIAIFICTLIQLEQYRWAYGRKWRPSRMPSSEIKLPVDATGKPDWEYMENFVKTLDYSSSI